MSRALKCTLSSLTGQLPHVTDVRYYFLCGNVCLFRRKLGLSGTITQRTPQRGRQRQRIKLASRRGSHGEHSSAAVIADVRRTAPHRGFPPGDSPHLVPAAEGRIWYNLWLEEQAPLLQVSCCRLRRNLCKRERLKGRQALWWECLPWLLRCHGPVV